ncbi:hypothetical protein CDL15_Pgr009007 [Punica granatum]|uniref:Uncharacterized protein n=1 Tax=Punica granatum TaxID=22663 RepID=A0A218VXV5_PUNGR|nr:hypothetical protein CDL15_Pgr009007 [Punica granatum]
MNRLMTQKLALTVLVLHHLLIMGDFPAVSCLTDPTSTGVEKVMKKSSSEGCINGEIYGRKIGVGQPRSLRAYVKPSPPSPVVGKRSSMGNYAPPPPFY